MSGFGDRLKRERERRDTPLAEVARRTRIGIQYLEALERGDFDGLPGRRGFGKLYIRVYAELFGFDPEPVIAEYDQERLEQGHPDDADSHLEPELPRRARDVPPPRAEKLVPGHAGLSVVAAESVPGPAGPSAPSMTRTASMSGGSSRWWIAGGAVVLVALGALGVTLMTRAPRPADTPVPEPPATARSATPSAEPPPEKDDAEIGEDAAGRRGERAPSAASRGESTPPVSVDPPRVASAPASVATPRPVESGPLEVVEFELGTGVVDLRVVDVRREFREGTVASFLTRVRGGGPGRTIRHVWIHEARQVQSIALRLGSPDWRTYSKKTLYGTGDWAVEARDEKGRVLARLEFRCF